ncbi:uracil-DNA glycosylase [Rhodoblastus acidophilus]|uniref:Type-5 uracil-DNA glycosylase n=1 Tax=Candidatus Rhodoblastus alkanivorans TaxID=2954117 RepID=A0ABS9Z6D9_9HYPH|nr:uracil-DNA glycosylase [Candidatus Rhodoblastus alkanivorans]MCI4680107.1 uracil-DNA glycosylase [Candidatus Rhodoblastus alkanivorans]MCI4682985.1 uracil-DNA glycosylase [Candidatus Rhodoblastus alkanivorans]MDI4640295.1 uracil-DNA glycosylase [Rhodoblastus acidophilus]
MEPDADCGLCPRLGEFRLENRRALPDGFNAPVPAFGPLDAELLILGLAPGLHGANRTGRPFTGDWAGDLLYPALLRHGFAEGAYRERADDGLQLRSSRISNAVRCVPPQNKPTSQEIATCREFLEREIAAMPRLRALLCLGRIAHDSALRLFGEKAKALPFAHGAVHRLKSRAITLYDSYHCSRYNTNTGVLTHEMFEAVFARIAADLRAG